MYISNCFHVIFSPTARKGKFFFSTLCFLEQTNVFRGLEFHLKFLLNGLKEENKEIAKMHRISLQLKAFFTYSSKFDDWFSKSFIKLWGFFHRFW